MFDREGHARLLLQQHSRSVTVSWRNFHRESIEPENFPTPLLKVGERRSKLVKRPSPLIEGDALVPGPSTSQQHPPPTTSEE